jgi:hypothetical protein
LSTDGSYDRASGPQDTGLALESLRLPLSCLDHGTRLAQERKATMKKLIIRYIRYVLALLANIGFGRSLN